MLSTIAPVHAQTQEKVLRTLTVTGEGVENIATSLTEVQLGVEVSARSADAAQNTAAKQTAAVVDFLRSRQVERLQTVGIQLQPNYDYSNNQRKLLGYIATNTVSFRATTEKVGLLLDEAVKAGATRINGISFLASDQAIEIAQKAALKKATLEAQSQAEAVFQALNVQAKEIVSVRVNGATPPIVPKIQADYAMRAAAAPPTPVIGGEQTVRASVTLQIAY
ncbi:MAG: SIMPL domain-containing protein [Snowella sp.]|nr:SIMPL domain-containing protein [Snowella sp.]